MRVEKFKVEKPGSVVGVISAKFSNLSQNKIRSILKNKDIKIDGVRVKENVFVDVGQEITFFVKDAPAEVLFDIVFEDENVLIANKPQGIETISEVGNDYVSALSKYKNMDLFAVHRLDRNTMGLVVFAKTKQAKEELDIGFKNRTIYKNYLALVYGCGLKQSDEMVAYLKKMQINRWCMFQIKKKLGLKKFKQTTRF